MKLTFGRAAIFLLALAGLAGTALAQSSRGRLKQPSRAAVHVIVEGPGRVSPFHEGQLLAIGRDYVMTAIPDRGQQFAGWNPVNVFTFTEYVTDEWGNVSAITNIVTSPVPSYRKGPILRFQVAPAEVIYEVPGVRTIAESRGWEANFVPRR